MKKINFLFILLILSACAPQVTVTSKVTVTLPSPTAIIIPTSTLHPQFIELQNQIAASGETFILMSNGKIEFQSPSGVVYVDGIAINPDGSGTFTSTDGEIGFDPNGLVFDAKSLTFLDVNGKLWKWSVDGGLVVAAEVLPDFVMELQKNGIQVDTEKGMAWDPDSGRVMGLVGPDGTWSEMPNGEAVFNLTNGETMTFPIVKDIDSALNYAINEVGVWWGNSTAWMRSAQTVVDQKLYKNFQSLQNRLTEEVHGDVTLCQSEAPKVCAPIKVGDIVLDDGNYLTMVYWRSKSDGNLHSVIIVGDTQGVLDELNSGSVVVPVPAEGN